MLRWLRRLGGFQIVRVRGGSMAPALGDGSWTLFRRWAPGDPGPERFDVVRLEDPVRPGAWVVKRVIGLPGETVELRAGALLVDGRRLREPHATGQASSSHRWSTGEGEIVVLGDNRLHSTDSRQYGTVSLATIRGRLLRPRMGP
jgi:signal peptidase I